MYCSHDGGLPWAFDVVGRSFLLSHAQFARLVGKTIGQKSGSEVAGKLTHAKPKLDCTREKHATF